MTYNGWYRAAALNLQIKIKILPLVVEVESLCDSNFERRLSSLSKFSQQSKQVALEQCDQILE